MNKPWLSDHMMAGGGAMFDTGVYPVQAGCYLTGETPNFATAVATKSSLYPEDIEDTMSFMLEYPSGVVLQGRVSYAYNCQQLIANCEKGSVSMLKKAFGQSGNGKPNPKELVLPNGTLFKQPDTLQLAVLHDAFAQAIRTKTPFFAPGEMGLRDIRIVEAIYASVAQGGKRVAISA